MAAVAPAQYETHTVNLEYGAIRCDAEATGEQKLKAGIVLEKPVRVKNLASTEAPQAEHLSGSEINNDSSSRGETHAGVANLANGNPQSDGATAEEELSDAEKSIMEEKDGSGKGHRETNLEVVASWEGPSEAVEKAEVEVANRNNCMLVFWHQKNFAFLI